MITKDACLTALDGALRTVFAPAQAARPTPRPQNLETEPAALTDAQARLSAALMRVNHVGEVCAQALYSAQAVFSKTAATRTVMQQAAEEETDHLAWTESRIKALGSHTSRLNPLWYAGAFAIGAVAARLGDGFNLGFVAETERQVGAHLQSHLDRLPANDAASRAIVMQMQQDEAEHAQMAVQAGGQPLPAFVPPLMKAASKVMTTVAHRI